jgi:nucleoside 2-deoxyribosyltransferase
MTKPSVFITYGRRDAEMAARVQSALENLGLEVLNPARELWAGADWRGELQSAIKRSDALIALVSTPHYLQSSWTSYEVGMAEALGKQVMLLLPDKYPATELPEDFASTQVVDFDPQAPERAAREIASRLAVMQ